MKPIIIGVNKEGKVDMTLDEFRKFMDDAYCQGYRDKTPSLSNVEIGQWWNSQLYNLCSTSNESTLNATKNSLNE